MARAERRRARGKAHDATIRQIVIRDGEEAVYERKKVTELKLADLCHLKDIDRNRALHDSLKEWIEAGCQKDSLPRSPKGDVIGKVRLKSKAKVNIPLYRGQKGEAAGTVDRGDMARVDVFCKATARGVKQYFLVPIYPHEIATSETPPMRAVAANVPESEWPVMDESYEFLWSLTPMSYLEAVSNKGEVFSGYYRGMNRSVGAISISPHENVTELVQGIGARTLKSFRKFAVDRLGGLHEVQRETRTWRGKVCT